MSLPALPPLLPSGVTRPARPFLAGFLGLLLGLFLIQAAVSLASDSLLLFFNRDDLVIADGLAFLLMLVTGFFTFGLMALIPGIPKRFFLPVSLFIPVAFVGILPLLVYQRDQAMVIFWGVSLGQLLVALFLVRRVQGGWKLRWPLFPEGQLVNRRFSFGNLLGVLLAGVLVLLPALALYAAFSATLAVDYFTDGFVALRPSGITMQVRKYVRDDGRKIMLVPMSHVGEPKFYQDLAASFPANSVILMEGVSDTNHLTTGHLDYSLAASATGGVAQAAAFKPQGELVRADVDMSSFSPETLDLLKVAMLIHAKGVTAETLPLLLKPTPPGLEELLIEDLLTNRNRHLLEILHERLPNAESIVVPWGAAHMPEIAREILKAGFRMVESQDYIAIRFGS